MIRVLLMIAAAGFVLCVACLTGAFAIGGQEAITRGGWTMFGSEHGFNVDPDWRPRHEVTATRQIAWTGDTLVVNFPADVRYVQGDGPATVTAPASVVNDIVVQNGELTLPGHNRTHGLQIVLTAPNVNHFEVRTVADLAIENYHQDQLVLKMSGSGDASVKGQASRAEVDVSGSGDADLSDLALSQAKVDVSGSGDVAIAPKDAADIKLTASGDVELLTRPTQLNTQTLASGRVREGRRDDGDDDERRSEGRRRGPGKSV